jgi:hypothetical protein
MEFYLKGDCHSSVAKAPRNDGIFIDSIALESRNLMKQETIFILAVALITWGGVFFYLLRLNFLTREIETKINQHNEHYAENTAQE